jgi:hypothetical protein
MTHAQITSASAALTGGAPVGEGPARHRPRAQATADPRPDRSVAVDPAVPPVGRLAAIRRLRGDGDREVAAAAALALATDDSIGTGHRLVAARRVAELGDPATAVGILKSVVDDDHRGLDIRVSAARDLIRLGRSEDLVDLLTRPRPVTVEQPLRRLLVRELRRTSQANAVGARRASWVLASVPRPRRVRSEQSEPSRRCGGRAPGP